MAVKGRSERAVLVAALLAVFSFFTRNALAYTEEGSGTDRVVYVFLEQAFPVLGEERGLSGRMEGWMNSVLPWSVEEREDENTAIEYDVLNAPYSERFSGYPEDEKVSEVAQPRVLSDLKGQYDSQIIQNFSYLQNLYGCDSGDVVRSPDDLDGQKFMSYDFTTDLSGQEPLVLIFHTHGSEGYADCGRYGVIEVGDYLAKILSERYGISVLHHKAIYDEDGISGAYERMSEGVSKVLEEHPSIQVAIDLHRDGIGGDGRLSCEVDGKPTAQVMLVNGLCKKLDANGIMQTGSLVQNPYLEDNLAFSFHLKMAADTLYSGWMRNMYLKAYRYSTFMLPKSILLEVGAEGNTLEEAKNAMEPFAEVLYAVLSGNG